MIRVLGQRFINPQHAKDFFKQGSAASAASDTAVVVQASSIESGSSLEIVHSDSLMEHIAALSADEQLNLMSDLFSSHASSNYGLTVPPDFIKLSLQGMKHLEAGGRLNGLAKGFGTKRPDGSDSCFPTTRMPIGLLQYMIQFFITKPGLHVSAYLLLQFTYFSANNFCRYIAQMTTWGG